VTLNPGLDLVRLPRDWLAAGLRTTGPGGPLGELYRREIEGDPAEALGDRYRRLLEAMTPAAALADLLEWRWDAAGRFARWEVIGTDLAAFRTRLAREDEDAWVQVLLAAVDQLAWGDDAAWELLATCREELQRYDHLFTRHASGFDQLDFLLDLAGAWLDLREADFVPEGFLELIHLSWLRPFSEIRPMLLTFLGRINREPRRMLEGLSEVYQQSPALLAQFGTILDILEASGNQEPTGPAVAHERTSQIRDFLDFTVRVMWQDFRTSVLDFCLREAIAPEELAEYANGRDGYRLTSDRHLTQAISEDWPLRQVCRAHRLFWR
jgi:hypothetical protein